MSVFVKRMARPLLFSALGAAAATLRDENKLKTLVVSAGDKLNSAHSGIKSVGNDARTLRDLVGAWMRREYRDVPWSTLLLTAGALVYFVNPLDAIPDIVPATGLIDDAGVIGFVLASVKNDIEKFRKWQADSTGVGTGSKNAGPEMTAGL
ncbi:MAG: DUF1232 domain-containing protein [Candidatus Dadabacteria bacterium]|nr:DUF1232 domain-containing protein [Candidatus Dadabacteria bacterium]